MEWNELIASGDISKLHHRDCGGCVTVSAGEMAYWTECSKDGEGCPSRQEYIGLEELYVSECENGKDI